MKYEPAINEISQEEFSELEMVSMLKDDFLICDDGTPAIICYDSMGENISAEKALSIHNSIPGASFLPVKSAVLLWRRRIIPNDRGIWHAGDFRHGIPVGSYRLLLCKRYKVVETT